MVLFMAGMQSVCKNLHHLILYLKLLIWGTVLEKSFIWRRRFIIFILTIIKRLHAYKYILVFIITFFISRFVYLFFERKYKQNKKRAYVFSNDAFMI